MGKTKLMGDNELTGIVCQFAPFCLLKFSTFRDDVWQTMGEVVTRWIYAANIQISIKISGVNVGGMNA